VRGRGRWLIINDDDDDGVEGDVDELRTIRRGRVWLNTS
jgi:hypothetical protein